MQPSTQYLFEASWSSGALDPELQLKSSPHPAVQNICMQAGAMANRLRAEIQAIKNSVKIQDPYQRKNAIQGRQERGKRWINDRVREVSALLNQIQPNHLDLLYGCLARVAAVIGSETQPLRRLRGEIDKRLTDQGIHPESTLEAELETLSGKTSSSQRVRFFTCSNRERSQVENFLQMSIPVETLRSAVDDAASIAVSAALKAAAALESSPRSTPTKRLFCEAFGVAPEFVPAWRPAKARWKDLGGLVAIRLRNAAKILAGGWIKYFCWGSSIHCPECSASPPTYFACSSFKGKYIICLGQGFWRAWQARDTATTASTLLHEALHIYFGRTVADQRFSGNANCYERFAVQFNGLFLHPATDSNCPAKNCVGV